MNKSFPVAPHAAVACFKCQQPMPEATIIFTQYPDGLGRFAKVCPTCSVKTWYDLPKVGRGRMRRVPITHGTSTGYTNRGCRCEPCRLASNAYQRTRQQSLKAEGKCVSCPRPADAGVRCLACCARLRELRKANRERKKARHTIAP